MLREPLPPQAALATNTTGPSSIDYEYDTFISYAREDHAFARRLEQRLEAYKPPKGLSLPTRNLRVFLDTSDIRGPDYEETIERELRRSRTLIVVCSPAARASKYVDDEIRRFIALRRAEDGEPLVLALLLHGIPNNEANAAYDEDEKAFPEALYDVAKMPLAQSYVGFDPTRHKLERGGYRDAWFATLAGILGVERHDLEERDATRQARTRNLLAGITLAVLFIVSLIAAFAWIQWGAAQTQRDQALKQESRALAALAQNETANGNAVNGMLLALRGMPIADAAEPRPPVTETRQALVDAMQARQELLVLHGHGEEVSAVSRSPDGARIVSGSWDGTIRIWDSKTGEALLVIRVGEESEGWLRAYLISNRAEFSPDGGQIVGGWGDLQVWDAANGVEITLPSLGFYGTVRAAALSPDGARVVMVGSDEGPLASVWDVATGEELASLDGHGGALTSVAFSQNAMQIVTGSYDNTVRLWNSATGEQLMVLRGHEGAINTVGFSPDGASVVSGSEDRTIRVWETASGEEMLALRGHEGAINTVGFSPDGASIVSGSEDRTIRIWEMASGEEILALRGHDGSVNDAVFLSGGRRIVSGASDGTVRVWSATNKPELKILRGHDDTVFTAAFAPNGAWIATGSYDKTIRVWDGATGAELHVLSGESPVRAVAFAPDGERLVSASDDYHLRVWDMAESTNPLVLRGHEKAVLCAAFSPDGSRIVSGSVDGTVRVWDASTGVELLTLRVSEHNVSAVAFSPDGARIVSGSEDETIRVWDATEGEEMLILRGHGGGVNSVGYSPDGHRIVSGSRDKTIRVWDAAKGEELMVLSRHDGAVLSVAFSPDGARIVSGSEDETIRVWDATEGEEQLILRGHDALLWGATVNTVGFSPDGAWIVSGSSDDTARLWFIGKDDSELVAYACKNLLRDLSLDATLRLNFDTDAPWPCAERAQALWPHPIQ